MSTLKNPVSADDHIQGDQNAPCTLVEYGDFECPHCGAAHPMVQALQKHFGERLAFVFRNFPLTRIHPHAQPAAEVAEFAASQGKFWEMHDQLFANQSRLGIDLFGELAGGLRLNRADMEAALENNTFTHRVNKDFTGGVRSGVNGTPTFFINGQRHDGPLDQTALTQAIEESIVGGRSQS